MTLLSIFLASSVQRINALRTNVSFLHIWLLFHFHALDLIMEILFLFCDTLPAFASIFGGLSINSTATISEAVLTISPYDVDFDQLSILKNDKLRWANRQVTTDGTLKVVRPNNDSLPIDFELLLNRVAYRLNVDVSCSYYTLLVEMQDSSEYFENFISFVFLVPCCSCTCFNYNYNYYYNCYYCYFVLSLLSSYYCRQGNRTRA